MLSSEDQPVDQASAAPEVDPSPLAPEPYRFEEGLQSRFENTGLEHHKKESPLQLAELQSQPADTSPNNTTSRKTWILVISIAVAAIILGVSLGVGLGVGLKHQSTSPTPASSTSTPSSSNSTTSVQPTSTSGTLTNGVLSDTSLAAITTSEGNRHVFFQDFNQSLRHAVFAQSANTWLNGADYISTSPLPRNLTPIAVVEIRVEPSQAGFNFLHLFYIDINGFIAASSYLPGQSFGKNPTPPPMNSSFQVASASRTLSVTQIAPSQNGTLAEAVLLYETPTGNITALHGYFSGTSSTSQWVWENVSEAISAPLQKYGTWLRPPLASSCRQLPGHTQQVNICFSSPHPFSSALPNLIACADYAGWTGLLPNTSETFPEPGASTNASAAAIQSSDIVSYFAIATVNATVSSETAGAAWVQNGKLSITPNPATPYPFVRLTWLNNTNASATYFYHQLTDSVLVEDEYYQFAGWNTANITIESS